MSAICSRKRDGSEPLGRGYLPRQTPECKEWSSDGRKDGRTGGRVDIRAMEANDKMGPNARELQNKGTSCWNLLEGSKKILSKPKTWCCKLPPLPPTTIPPPHPPPPAVVWRSKHLFLLNASTVTHLWQRRPSLRHDGDARSRRYLHPRHSRHRHAVVTWHVCQAQTWKDPVEPAPKYPVGLEFSHRYSSCSYKFEWEKCSRYLQFT